MAARLRVLHGNLTLGAAIASGADPRLEDLAGVGPARAARLAAAGVHAVRDLLRLLPLGVEVAPAASTVAAALRAPRGVVVRVRGTLERTSLARFGRRSILRLRLADASGRVEARFHNQPWLQRQLTVGSEVELLGALEGSPAGFVGPRVGTAERPLPAPGALRVVHPALPGLSAEFLGGLCREAARREAAREPEPVPAEVLARLGAPPLPRALADLHAPTSIGSFEAARRRLALERLLELQARIHLRRTRAAAGAALACDVSAERVARARAAFPFAFTAAQERVAREIAADLGRARPMRRLLQGDVGSGKTAVGAFAALLAAWSGGQAAFMAPTELLAEQHHMGLAPLLERAGLQSGFLSGSLGARARRAVLARLAEGTLDVVFGTHALFSDDVAYRRLALAVVDEQHRFGVAQRGDLFDKGCDAHALLMSATPIPRTLALAWYGDLETSRLDEKPPGRGSVTTRWVRGAGAKDGVERLLLERAAEGERIFWVVPRIGGDDASEPEGSAGRRAESAEERHARLLASPLAAHGVELVHGRMPPAERARRLARFRAGLARTLVATTVIEVGVDVPEATVLVVEGAERLGLAQLHQLRGRVGRGERPSWCLILGAASGRRRFEVLERTADGFEIAEEDLRQRGMGDLDGVRQAGVNTEGFEEWGGDAALLDAAARLVAEDARVRAHYVARTQRELTP
ncbi:MAG: DEAD/DEAH box helicase [Planctomycetes bacterium]|nr:DEAD/DEAH box helicase [Planctomycetota bacterium]